MKLLLFTASAAILSLASAAPPPDRATCSHSGSGFVVGTSGPWGDDWGRGLLNSLRRECGQINDWGFSYSGNGQPSLGGTGTATFTTQKSSNGCVEKAIRAASGVNVGKC